MKWALFFLALSLSAFAVDQQQGTDPEALIIPSATPYSGLNPTEPNPAPALGTNQNPVGAAAPGAAPAKPADPQLEQAQQALQKLNTFVSGVAADPRAEKIKQKALLLAGDEKFIAAAQEMISSPKRKDMLFIQIGFFVIMLLVKGWRQSKAENWFQKMLIGFVCTVITVAGVSYFIPLFVLGTPFKIFTSTLWRVFFLT